ncbi:MAG: hypothetical protein HeimC2_16760 [Candidatus Heimdallarchaeota archaeon LC_2]|nr:MAG: hypothetical protein HeimC2_16760 [Candidatus Heimdallarchaeota archaeon LC_2]
MKESYRPGPIGALMDEYERALNDLIKVLSRFSHFQFVKIVDTETQDENCRSVETILNHVIGAGYAYSNYIREKIDMPITQSGQVQVSNIVDVSDELKEMFNYMLETVEDSYSLSEKDFLFKEIEVRWSQGYDIEQLLEHSIVHLLRHRRQLEKFDSIYFEDSF